MCASGAFGDATALTCAPVSFAGVEEDSEEVAAVFVLMEAGCDATRAVKSQIRRIITPIIVPPPIKVFLSSFIMV